MSRSTQPLPLRSRLRQALITAMSALMTLPGRRFYKYVSLLLLQALDADTVVRATSRRRYIGKPEQPFKVDHPLILVTQVQRSGGSLLSQLFDGHPEIFGFPQELVAVKPNWPDFDRLMSHNNVRRLQQATTHDHLWAEHVIHGYQKAGPAGYESRMAFKFDMRMRNLLFTELGDSMDMTGRDKGRAFFEIYFSSFYNAWLNYCDLDKIDRKKAVAGFCPQTNVSLARAGGRPFFDSFPDGHIVTVVRDPESWIKSAWRRGGGYQTPKAFEWWQESALASQALLQAYPDRVTAVSMESLLTNPRDVMGNIADRCGLTWDDSLLEPTFNGIPIPSNSSVESSHGISTSPVRRNLPLPKEIDGTRELTEAQRTYDALRKSLA